MMSDERDDTLHPHGTAGEHDAGEDSPDPSARDDRTDPGGLCRNLTEEARNGMLTPFVGGTEQLEQMSVILAKKKKNNVMLIGPAGVGKTALVEGLASLIVDGRAKEELREKEILALDMISLVADTQIRGSFEGRLRDLVRHLGANRDRFILFVDEFHTAVGAGAQAGGLDLANLLKPALARGEVQCIAATTSQEFTRYIESDKALIRRFQTVRVKEPTVAETVEILRGLRPWLERQHRVRIVDEVLEEAVQMSERFVRNRHLPDKAIDLLDEGCARRRLFPANPEGGPDEGVEAIRRQKEEAIRNKDFERAADLREQELRLREERGEARASGSLELDRADLAAVVYQWTGIPIATIVESEFDKLSRLGAELREKIVGQDPAIDVITRCILRNRLSPEGVDEPIGTFLLLGPTGVGKTETAKALAECLFGDRKALFTLDMSEYQESHTVSRLFGSPPGYVGHQEGGILTNHVIRHPYGVVLFDEIEKADPRLLDALLQVFDEGRMTDGKGEEADFRNTILIMTSNIRFRNADDPSIGFCTDEGDGMASGEERRWSEGAMRKALSEKMRPEFVNRIDAVVQYRSLDREDLARILEKIIRDLAEKTLAQHGIAVSIDDAARERLIRQSIESGFGVRGLKRLVAETVENAVLDRVIEARAQGRPSAGGDLYLSLRDGELYAWFGEDRTAPETGVEREEEDDEQGVEQGARAGAGAVDPE
jgi:ATP-dependent Clp protease ATP-binding subunit ClpC